MNNVVLMGRLTQKPKIKSVQGENPLTIAQYTLAVPRYYKKANNKETDFIRCVAFGKAAEFAGKYFTQGLRIVVSGRIQTSTYLNRYNEKVYTAEVIVDIQEFAGYIVPIEDTSEEKTIPDA
ncbi:MAG: single-stranded DNA-binding protein [Lachnospiraceae bacterium]|nr:single-stranded DNA-binding protein [Lachnospiraceae bacterium]MDY3747107.1 single-stranded DNA-binding protein [Lachnospiraceae bacterium]